MIITNALTHINFSDLPPTIPSTWDLTPYIPGGLLLPEHLQVRFRPVGSFWTPWQEADGWDEGTNTATFFRAGAIAEVEFRRVTPRYDPVLDPLAPTSRVSEKSLRINADQGMFVAQEWAAEFGVDSLSTSVITDGPNQLGLRQYAQNHHGGASFDSKRVSWDFAFSGGYIARAHVRAQAKAAGVWVPLTIDTDEDQNVISAAPFRFIGDYQLHLTLDTLPQPVTELIIYRHTPRTANVTSPADDTVLTANSLSPSARHAFFVAVELGEELAKVAPVCDCRAPLVYYTSLIYPLVVDEGIVALTPAALSGQTTRMTEEGINVGTPGIVAGSLQTTIAYLTYNNAIVENVSVDTPSIQAGALVVTIVYLSYNNAAVENISLDSPTIQSGSLNVVIAYLDYTAAQVESLSMGTPSITAGTLT